MDEPFLQTVISQVILSSLVGTAFGISKVPSTPL